MNRKTFLCQSVSGVLGCCAAAAFGHAVPAEAAPQTAPVSDPEKEFIQRWLADLMEAIDREPDEAIKVRLMGACGRACFERHDFKHRMPVPGRADADRLVEAMKANFEVWRDGNIVHVRFGPVSKGCYCPAARYRPAKANDLHCLCSRGTQQAIWETEFGRPVKVDLVESVRRGGKTCHFVVHLPSR